MGYRHLQAPTIGKTIDGSAESERIRAARAPKEI